MEHEKYSYPEALKYLAQKYHIEVEETERTPKQVAAQDKRESLFIVTNWAGNFFKETLWDTDDGRTIGLNYFRERGYRDDIIHKFELEIGRASCRERVKVAVRRGCVRE